MCEEIKLGRYDETPWGFRLTGGHDFGIPLTVVRVSPNKTVITFTLYVNYLIMEMLIFVFTGDRRKSGRRSRHVCWRYDN